MSFQVNSQKDVEVSVVKRNGDGSEDVLIKGSVADANIKTATPIRTVGVNIGVTMNMGNYQSMRIDVWSSDKIYKHETRKDAIFRVANDLAYALHELQDKYGGE